MTREEARREIDSLYFYLQNHTDDYGEESHTAMMIAAIKALEKQDRIAQILDDYDLLDTWEVLDDYDLLDAWKVLKIVKEVVKE